MQFLDKVCSHFAVQRQVPAFVWTSLVWRRGSSPWSICSCSWCSSRDKVVDVVHSPFEWLDHRCHCNCRDLVLFVGRLPRCGGVCVAMSCGGGFFTPYGAYDSVWDSVKPMTGKFIFNYFQYQEVVGCACMLNYGFSSNDDICQTTPTIPGSS